MLGSLISSKAKRYFLFILILLVSTDLSILLNIPILRQVLGFAFFTLIPGLLVLYILKLNKLGLTVKIVLSVGLSIAFLIFTGLIISWIYPAFGYNTPLSTNSLLIFFSIIILILTIFAYLTNRTASFSNLGDFHLNTQGKAFLLLPSLFPLLGILGVHLMNTTNNNVMLITLLALIPTYVILIVVLRHRVPRSIYPLIIIMVSVPLALMMAMRSNYIIGMDSHFAYRLFQLTSDSQHWLASEGGLLSSSLSISLLPAMYHSILNIDAVCLYKTLLSLIFSLSPLVIYIISRKYLSNRYAFLASFFFMAQVTFLWPAGRTHIAALFFILTIMVLFRNDINDSKKRLLFIIFTTTTIVSHYATTYICFFIFLITWLGMQILLKLLSRRRKPIASSRNPDPGGSPSESAREDVLLEKNNAGIASQYRFKSNISVTMAALFFVVLWLWYSQITIGTFDVAIRFVRVTLTTLNQSFLLATRGSEAAAILGAGLTTREIPWRIEFVFSWLTIALIAIGVLITMGRYKRMVAIPGFSSGQLTNILRQKFDLEYFVISLACCAILVFAIAAPFVLRGYSATRTYFQMMLVLSPFFVVGGITVARWLRVRSYWVILAVLIPYSMCVSGIMYQVFDSPRSIALNSEGTNYNYLYVHDQESFAARWLGDHGELKNAIVYSDHTGYYRLLSLGALSPKLFDEDSLIDNDKQINGGYIYLKYYNVVSGKLMDNRYQGHSIIEYEDKFAGRALIYNNGGSQFYYR